MPMTRDAARGPAVLSFLIILGLAVFASGCRVVGVEEPRARDGSGERVTMSTSATALPQYDVAISAIDFDPPLKSETMLTSSHPIKLVAAVENKGTMQLSRLVVEAKVTNQQGDFSTQDQVQVEKLSPGETKVVEFGGVGTVASLPRSAAFRIRVAVDAAQLDPDLPKPSRELIVRVAEQ